MQKKYLIKIIGIALLVMMVGSLAACSKKPTQEECRNGITRLMEIQIDALDAPGSTTSSMMREGMTEDQIKQSTDFLKAQIPSQLTPKVIAQCVDRVKREDLQCTMTASTQDELVQKCHLKVGSGPKGPTIGFEMH
ncbi:MAG: hypothetical protein NTW65_12840 [Deltaproteobacteria bacterium]|nr:hypothetical protein [Deltaproteobacteria bacterium]